MFKLLKKLLKDRRGISALVIATVIGLITIAIILPIGIVVTSNLKSVVDGMGLTGAANSTATQVFTNVYAAYNISTIIPIVAAAAAIILIITGALAYRASGR